MNAIDIILHCHEFNEINGGRESKSIEFCFEKRDEKNFLKQFSKLLK